MKNWFSEHPKSVNATYWQHGLFSAGYALGLLMAGMAGLLHAVFPFLCVNTCSDMIAKLAGIYCKGERRAGFLNKMNSYLPASEQCCIKKGPLDV